MLDHPNAPDSKLLAFRRCRRIFCAQRRTPGVPRALRTCSRRRNVSNQPGSAPDTREQREHVGRESGLVLYNGTARPGNGAGRNHPGNVGQARIQNMRNRTFWLFSSLLALMLQLQLAGCGWGNPTDPQPVEWPIAKDVFTTAQQQILPVGLSTDTPQIDPADVALYEQCGYSMWLAENGTNYSQDPRNPQPHDKRTEPVAPNGSLCRDRDAQPG